MNDPTEDILDKFFIELAELDGIPEWMNDQEGEFDTEMIFEEVRDHIRDTVAKSRQAMTKFRRAVLDERNAWKAEALASRAYIKMLERYMEAFFGDESSFTIEQMEKELEAYLIARRASPFPDLTP